jgi:hypothetical protein
MPYKKGQTGNPNGRPKKGDTLTDILISELGKKGNREKLAQKLIELSMKGNIHAIKYIYDRVDGTPKGNLDLNHSGEVGVVINIPKDLMPKI